jgi:DNA-binding MarR family transcriptional regulator
MSEESLSIDREHLEQMRQQHIGRLLQQASRAFNVRAITKLQRYGHAGLSLAHTSLLSNLDLEGTRITVLAERAGMTKQSMGQLALDLEKRGYIQRVTDPRDHRATLILFTGAGWQFLQDAYQVKGEIETEYGILLGAEGMRLLRSSLQILLEQSHQEGEQAQ